MSLAHADETFVEKIWHEDDKDRYFTRTMMRGSNNSDHESSKYYATEIYNDFDDKGKLVKFRSVEVESGTTRSLEFIYDAATDTIEYQILNGNELLKGVCYQVVEEQAYDCEGDLSDGYISILVVGNSLSLIGSENESSFWFEDHAFYFWREIYDQSPAYGWYLSDKSIEINGNELSATYDYCTQYRHGECESGSIVPEQGKEIDDLELDYLTSKTEITSRGDGSRLPFRIVQSVGIRGHGLSERKYNDELGTEEWTQSTTYVNTNANYEHDYAGEPNRYIIRQAIRNDHELFRQRNELVHKSISIEDLSFSLDSSYEQEDWTISYWYHISEQELNGAGRCIQGASSFVCTGNNGESHGEVPLSVLFEWLTFDSKMFSQDITHELFSYLDIK